MNRGTREVFRRLEDQRRSRPPPEPRLDFFGLKPRPSLYGKGSLGYFADQLAMPVNLLIQQFAAAGITGLEAEHRIHQDQKKALLEHLRAMHRVGAPTTKVLFTHEIATAGEISLVQEVNEELLAYLSKNPGYLYQLPSRRFEELVARLFEDQGCTVSLTKSTRDGGYDVLAKLETGFSSFLILAECKRYSPENKVGVEIVRGLYGVTEINRVNQGLIVTSSFFTRDAQEEQLRIGNRIALKDFNDLVAWLGPYSK